MTKEPPDSACEIKSIHSVTFEGTDGAITFGRETKRALEGSGFDPSESELQPVRAIASMWSVPMTVVTGPPIFDRYVVRIDGTEVHLTETQLRALVRGVRAAFLKS